MPNLYSVKTLPSKGNKLGDIYFCTSTKETFVCLADLRLFNMAGLLTVSPVAVVGPKGEPGRSIVGPPGPKGDSIIGPAGPRGPSGQSIVGPKGADGLPGPPGKDGRDAVGIQGPQGIPGQSIVGPKGDKGDRGDVMIPNELELAAAVLAYRHRVTRVQAALLFEISRAKNLRPSTRLHVQRVLKSVQAELQ